MNAKTIARRLFANEWTHDYEVHPDGEVLLTLTTGHVLAIGVEDFEGREFVNYAVYPDTDSDAEITSDGFAAADEDEAVRELENIITTIENNAAQ